MIDLLSVPRTIPLICCHIKSFRRASSCGRPGPEARREAGGPHHEACGAWVVSPVRPPGVPACDGGASIWEPWRLRPLSHNRREPPQACGNLYGQLDLCGGPGCSGYPTSTRRRCAARAIWQAYGVPGASWPTPGQHDGERGICRSGSTPSRQARHRTRRGIPMCMDKVRSGGQARGRATVSARSAGWTPRSVEGFSSIQGQEGNERGLSHGRRRGGVAGAGAAFPLSRGIKAPFPDLPARHKHSLATKGGVMPMYSPPDSCPDASRRHRNYVTKCDGMASGRPVRHDSLPGAASPQCRDSGPRLRRRHRQLHDAAQILAGLDRRLLPGEEWRLNWRDHDTHRARGAAPHASGRQSASARRVPHQAKLVPFP